MSRSARFRSIGLLARRTALALLAAVTVGCGILGDSQVEVPDETLPAASRRGPPSVPEPGQRAAVAERARDWAEGLDQPPLAWTFRTASPVSGAPAVSADGSVYVSTVEGYVHALSPSGTFRWSYTVKGTPIGAPRVDGDGVVYLATNAYRVYALSPDGHLRWRVKTHARVAGEVAWAAPGFVYYAAHDRRLYALTAWGSPLWNRQLGGEAAGPPAPLGQGIVAIATRRPELWLLRGAAHAARLELPDAPREPPLAGKDHWFVVCAGELIAIGTATREIAWRRPARRVAVSSDGAQLVAVGPSAVSWLDEATGESLRDAPLPGQLSGRPVVTPEGALLAPLVTGELAVVRADAREAARTFVSGAPVWPPQYHAPTNVAVVASGSVVGVIQLPAPLAKGEPDE